MSDPRWGTYRQRGAALGIPVFAFDCVDQRAVEQAQHIVQHMLQDAEQGTLETMLQGGAEVAVIGRHQGTTDLPMYRHLRGVDCENGGGDYDAATRGLGGNPGEPSRGPRSWQQGSNGGMQQGSRWGSWAQHGSEFSPHSSLCSAHTAHLSAAAPPLPLTLRPLPVLQATPPPAAGRRTC